MEDNEDVGPGQVSEEMGGERWGLGSGQRRWVEDDKDVGPGQVSEELGAENGSEEEWPQKW